MVSELSGRGKVGLPGAYGPRRRLTAERQVTNSLLPDCTNQVSDSSGRATVLGDRLLVGLCCRWDTSCDTSAMWPVADGGSTEWTNVSVHRRRTHTSDPYADGDACI